MRYQCLGLYSIMFAFAAILDFSGVVYETETAVFFPKTDRS